MRPALHADLLPAAMASQRRRSHGRVQLPTVGDLHSLTLRRPLGDHAEQKPFATSRNEGHTCGVSEGLDMRTRYEQFSARVTDGF